VEDGQLDDIRLELEELSAARARLVAAADAERRRIERDLHDGVQQQLVALAVNLQLARQLADTDPSSLKPLLDQVRRDVLRALEDVRRLASRVYPTILQDRGLVEALRAAASEAELPTRVETTSPLERYPPEIEAAAYFSCLEAIDNAAGLQAASRATVELRQANGTLVFEVVVDGDGSSSWAERIPTAVNDRLAAVGGRLATWADGQRYVRITGTIPLHP
jgi:signal transduction histidine kinase